MSGVSTADFIAYWLQEGNSYAKHGDYAWMASLINGQRILDIGCGVGFGTAAMLERGLSVLALDNLVECLDVCRQRAAALGQGSALFLQAELTDLSVEARTSIEEFAPDTLVCWLMGAPAEVTGASQHDAGKAVAAYRERMHRLVAELAASLPTVRFLHLVDRTAIPWQAKDIGRDTLVRYHAGKTLLDLPFTADRRNALYRKLDGNVVDFAEVRRSHPSLKSVTPTLASLVAERKH